MRVRREEMNATTQCPTCNTRFKVTQEQLNARQGLVRCGSCQAVFNATEYLQSSALIALESVRSAADESASESIAALHPASVPLSIPVSNSTPSHALSDKLVGTEQLEIGRHNAEQPALMLPNKSAPPPRKKPLVWPWMIGNLVVILLLLGQAAYFFRVEIAANSPGLKPALIAYCRPFHCTVPLPHKAEFMSIESSDLEADPAQASVISLNALLRNHAAYTQAYPVLELTLTDAQDGPLARRTFQPAEYLKPSEDIKEGISANRELIVKLNLDTTDLKPSGYRLFLFYPQ